MGLPTSHALESAKNREMILGERVFQTPVPDLISVV